MSEGSMRQIFWYGYLALSALAFVALAFLGVAYFYNQYFAEYRTVLPAFIDGQNEPQRKWSTDDPDVVRILAIDGGGVFGIAELEVLKAIEERSGKQTHELFDFVAGSSTGAIIASLLLLTDPETGVPRSAEDVIELYEEFAVQVLNVGLSHRIITINGLFGPYFTNQGRIKIATELFGEAAFGDLVRPAMFPGYVHTDQGVRFFRNWKSENSRLLVSSLVTAVTSAEIIFPSVELDGLGSTANVVSDPGFILNSPGHMAYVKAREEQPDATKFIVVTVSNTFPFTLSKRTRIGGGALDWARPLANIVFAGERSLSQQALEAHSRYQTGVSVENFAFLPNTNSANAFDPSTMNIDAVRRGGIDYVAKSKILIDRVIMALDHKG
ncbi:MAG: patatin-like phospholipase family protein [Pseudomonadota bacterium]